MRRIGVVIVHHGDEVVTLEALRSVRVSRGVDPLVVVVDHGPGTGEELARAAREGGGYPVRPEENLGYAGGLQVGVDEIRRQGGAELYLFLNNDIVLAPDAVAILASRFDEAPGLGVAGPAVLFHDRELIWNAGSEIDWPRGQPRSLFHLGYPGELPRTPYPVGFICGCAMMVSALLLERIGPLPVEYFLYFEDAEISFRARADGFQVEVVPLARVRHRERSGVKESSALVAYCRARNRIVFSRRFAPPGLMPRLARFWFILGRILRGRADRRGVLDGLRGLSGRTRPSALLEKIR